MRVCNRCHLAFVVVGPVALEFGGDGEVSLGSGPEESFFEDAAGSTVAVSLNKAASRGTGNGLVLRVDRPIPMHGGEAAPIGSSLLVIDVGHTLAAVGGCEAAPTIVFQGQRRSAVFFFIKFIEIR